MKFQIGTSSYNNYGGVRKIPYVFTEQGVAMLPSVLRTEIATKVSVEIMRAFVMMRKYISNELLEQKYINNLVLKNNDKLLELEDRALLLQEREIINLLIDKIKKLINNFIYKHHY